MSNCDEPKHLIIDWESVGNGQKNPKCGVPSIGLLVFKPSEILEFPDLVSRAFKLKFNLSEQFQKFGRTWDQDTIDFWNAPEQVEAKKMVIEPSPQDISLSQMGPLVKQYLEHMGYSEHDFERGGKIWSRGNAFDFPIFSNVYDYFGWDEPFPFWAVRDVRSNIDAIAEIWDPQHEGWGYVRGFPYPEGFIKHMETHDISRDVLMMQYNYSKLGEWMDNLINGG